MERLTRLLTVALLLLAYAPLPRPPRAAEGKMACCAPKVCDHPGKGCVSGGGCKMADSPMGDASTGTAAVPATGAASHRTLLLAGRCGGQTPAVTPVTFDPSVAPALSTLSAPAIAGHATPQARPDHPILQTEPSVPPPRA